VPPPPPGYAPAPLTSTVARRGLAGRVGAAVVGVAVLGGGLAYAVTQAGSGGGASTPEAAAQALFDAVADEDVLGVLDLLPAGERRAIQRPVQSIAEELERLGVVDDSFDLSDIGGVDLEFEGLEFATEPLGPGITAVRLTAGTVISSVEPDEVPVGKALDDAAEEMDAPIEIAPVEERDEFDPAEDDLQLVAIEEDGDWRVSLFYSIAELARSSAELPLPDFGHGVAPNGQESPEAAVDALLRAVVEDQDVEGVIALLPPDEMAALQDYAPLFLDDLDGWEDDLSDFSASIDDLDLEAHRDGDVATVGVKAVAGSATVDGEPWSLGYDGECITIEGPDDSTRECVGDTPAGLDDSELPITWSPDAFVGLTTVQVDGAWYVSPTRTILDAVVSLLRSLHDDALDHLDDLFDSFFGFSDTMSGSYDSGSCDAGVDGEGYDCGSFEEQGSPITPTTVVSVDDPSVEGLAATLAGQHGFDLATAACMADALYAAGLDVSVLAELEAGGFPDAAIEPYYDALDACPSG
jgi:hypothetical protein